MHSSLKLAHLQDAVHTWSHVRCSNSAGGGQRRPVESAKGSAFGTALPNHRAPWRSRRAVGTAPLIPFPRSHDLIYSAEL